MKGRWWKRGGLFLSVLALINISAPFSELLPIAYAYTCPDESTAASQAECPTVANNTSTPSSVDFSAANISFTRVNRTLIKVGEAWFTSDDPTGDNYTYTSVGLECSAKLTYKPETNSGDNYSSSTWTIEYKKYLTSTKTCDSATTTKSLPNDPTNNGENQRYWTVFYKNGNKVYSVLKDNSTTFTKKGTINGVDVYIEDGKEATACPQLITNRGSEWLYIPIKHVDSAGEASNEYAGAMKQLLGVSEGVNCNPTGDSAEKEGLLNGFGLPKDYFKRGKVNEHDGYHPLGFSNNYMHGAVLAGGMPGTEAAGIGANGPNANGKGVGNGKMSSSSSGSGEGKTTCSVAGIGWIVCPVLTFLGEITDNSYKIIADNFLSVDTKLIETGSDTYKAWQSFRNVANIAFVFVFLVIIYSQITTAGISNYGIKRMLPRLIIAAILVNISYFLCQVAVDISQILGYNIKAFLDSAITLPKGSSGGTWSTVGQGLTWVTIIAGAIIASGLALLALSIPVLLSSLLAVLMIVLILMGRKALIVLLVVVSPIAFVAYLLPNTEKWFKKWWNMFFTLLMLFPLIGLVFGASKLAGNILAANSDQDMSLQITAMGVSTIPFFVVPSLLKGALTATGSLGAKLQGMSNKATSRVGKKVGSTSMIGALSKQYGRNQQMKRAQVLSGHSGNKLTKGYYGRLNKMTGKYGDRISAQGAATAQKLKSEDVDNEVARMQAESDPHSELADASNAYYSAMGSGDIVRARASQKILLSKGNAGVSEIRKRVEQLGSTDNDAVKYARADLASAGLKSKDAALNQWSYDSDQRSLADIDKDAKTYTGLSDSEFATQSVDTMSRAVASTGIDKDGNRITGLSADRAQRLMTNPDVQKDLNEDKYRVLTQIHGRGGVSQASSNPPAPTPPISPSAPSAQPATPSVSITHNGRSFEQTDGGLFIPTRDR